MSIQTNIAEIRSRIAAACAEAGCDCWTDLAGFPDTGINTMVFIH